MTEYVYECEECGEIFESERELSGEELKCPSCGGRLKLIGRWEAE